MSSVTQIGVWQPTGNAVSASAPITGTGPYQNMTCYVVGVFNGNTLSPTISDSQSNTWTLVDHTDAGSSALSSIYVWTSQLGTALNAGDTVTVNRGGSGDIVIRVCVVPLGTGLDGTAVVATGTGTAVATAGVTIGTNSIIVQEVVGQTSAVTLAPEAGFTGEADINSTGASSNRYLHGEFNDAGTAGTIAATSTLSAAQQWGAVSFGIAQAAAAPINVIASHAAVANESSGTVTLPATPIGTWVSVHATMNGTISPTITDTKGQTWTTLPLAQPVGTALTTGAVFTTRLTSAWTSSDTLTVTRATSGALAFDVITVTSGVVLDGTAVTAIGSAGSSTAATASQTFNPGSILLACIVGQSSGVTITPTSGFTALPDEATTGTSSNRFLHGEYKAGATSPVTQSVGLSSSQQWGMISYAVALTPPPSPGTPWVAANGAAVQW